MNSLDKQIRDRIQTFAEELAELVKGAAVESVQEALGQAMASPARKKASRRGRPAGVKGTAGRKSATGKKAAGRIRRSPEQLEAMSSKILAHIKANPGQRLEQIAVDLRMDTSEMKRPVALMVKAKRLSTKGQRRGTTYYAGKARAGKKATRTAPRNKATKGTRKKAAGRKKTTRKKATRRKALTR